MKSAPLLTLRIDALASSPALNKITEKMNLKNFESSHKHLMQDETNQMLNCAQSFFDVLQSKRKEI